MWWRKHEVAYIYKHCCLKVKNVHEKNKPIHSHKTYSVLPLWIILKHWSKTSSFRPVCIYVNALFSGHQFIFVVCTVYIMLFLINWDCVCNAPTYSQSSVIWWIVELCKCLHFCIGSLLFFILHIDIFFTIDCMEF